jgi:hypothetical protein
MKARCLSPNAHAYSGYGGRGIKVCERWLGEDGFKNFIDDMGKRPEGMSLDRYPDNNGNYEKSNCRWATQKQQTNNTRATRIVTYNNETLPLTAMCEKYGFNYHLVRSRINRKLPEKLWFIPLINRKGRKYKKNI